MGAKGGPRGNTPPRQFRLAEETMRELQEIADHYTDQTGVPHSRADAIRIAARKERDRIRRRKGGGDA